MPGLICRVGGVTVLLQRCDCSSMPALPRVTEGFREQVHTVDVCTAAPGTQGGGLTWAPGEQALSLRAGCSACEYAPPGELGVHLAPNSIESHEGEKVLPFPIVHPS